MQVLIQSNLDIILSILGACNLGTQIKDLYVCVEEEFKFFIDYAGSKMGSLGNYIIQFFQIKDLPNGLIFWLQVLYDPSIMIVVTE